MQQRVIIIDGECLQTGYAGLETVEHARPAALSTIGRDDFLVLNLGGDELQSMLGTVFRRKRPFALTSLEGMSLEQLRHLGATLKNRRITAYLLGGRRLLPGVSALREVIGGGCLGEVCGVDVTVPQATQGGPVWQGGDLASWLGAGLPAESRRVSWQPERMLRITVSGTVGHLAAELNFDQGEGQIEVEVGGHRRVRGFEPSAVTRMEMNVLQAFGTSSHGVPGLVPINALIPALLGAGASQSCPAATASMPKSQSSTDVQTADGQVTEAVN